MKHDRGILTCISACVLAVGLTAPAVASEDIMIVFDMSSSMDEIISGGRKIDLARESLGNVLRGLEGDPKLGLTLFGAKGSGCKDVDVVSRPQTGNASRIASVVNRTSPSGSTPLAQAIWDAAHSMNLTREKVTLVVLSDGEDTCGYNICSTANDLVSKSKDLTIHVIGFGLSSSQDRAVSCMAVGKKGQYFAAKNASDLSKALSKSLQSASSAPSIGDVVKDFLREKK